MKSGWWIGSRMLGAGLILAGGARPSAALTVTFDPPGSPPSIATSYTEAGLTVAPDVSGFYVMLGDHDGNGSPDLENHPACCSTPYRFTCTQPPNTCRVLVTFANVPNLTLLRSRLGRTTLTSFTPLTPGCSRKVSITLDPTRRINKLSLKASGTVGGLTKRDGDSFKFLGF
jgi:hypothetical protein